FMAMLIAAALTSCGATVPPPMPPPPPSAPTPPPFDEAATWVEIDAAERSLAVSAGDCLRACEAASTIAKARSQLCDHHVARCEEAQARSARATTDAQSTCGDCPATQ
ncbi:MAG: hypothetical protein ACHREM_30615, partial [Polyangiales bacterium]